MEGSKVLYFSPTPINLIGCPVTWRMEMADAMTGQDAVNSAEAFNNHLSITGAISPRWTATHAAALPSPSARSPGSHQVPWHRRKARRLRALPSRPHRRPHHGHGRHPHPARESAETVDQRKAEEFAKKALCGDGFSLEDFRDQLRQIKKLGPCRRPQDAPQRWPLRRHAAGRRHVDEGQFTRVESIINSMTAKERNHHEIINGSRRKRIARGSGTTVQEVNNLLRQYAQMRKMFKAMGKSSFSRKLAGMKLPGMMR